MKIAIFASIWEQNLWDELILKNQIKILEEKYEEKIDFLVFTYDKKNVFYSKENINYYNYFPIWIRKPSNFLKNIIAFLNFLRVVFISDLIIIWWWWIIYDNEVQKNKSPLDSWVFRINIFNLFFKKYEFFRIWINIKQEQNYKKLKRIFKKAKYISVRDEYSKELLSEVWINSTLEKDPVFFDKPNSLDEKYLIWKIDSFEFNIWVFEKFNLQGKKVGLAIRSGYFFEKSKISSRMEEWRVREIINYLTNSWAEVILMPHSFHPRDEMANDFIFLNKFAWVPGVTIKKNMEEIYAVYKSGEIDFCVAMRLHSIILSHIYEIPFLGVSYSKKTDQILNQLSD